MIRFSDVSLEYSHGTAALSGINLEIARREFVFLTGPSGAGKSTLLKCIYMDVRPSVMMAKMVSRPRS